MPISTFEYLIHPVDTGTFGQECWEKKPLVVRRTDPDYYRGLLSLESVDFILSTSSIRPPLIRVVNEGKETPLKQLRAHRLGSPAVLLESLYEEYRNGSTIVLQSLHERWRPLADLCRSLAAELSAYLQVNAYLTPAHEKGLKTHYDAHDVFVLQAEGSKHWRIVPRSDPPTPSGPDVQSTSGTRRARRRARPPSRRPHLYPTGIHARCRGSRLNVSASDPRCPSRHLGGGCAASC